MKKFNIIIKNIHNLLEEEFESIFNILKQSDEEFQPSLSSRYPLSPEGYCGVKQYLLSKFINNTHFFLTYCENKVVAFMIVNEGHSDLKGPLGEIATTCVDKDFREYGLGVRLYQFADENIPVLFNAKVILRNTWSTNHKQIARYEKFGYKEYRREPKPDLEGVDAVYFYKIIESEESAEQEGA